ncbi:hypothetical protein NPIL_684041 [Nephila pilipes]|uniref:Uncharacterized protein n=1 Tax=Nephila pilipes TaxID=299642 RepID=A0A8X6Q6F7_NEPPI|nr:hypothetical protein NPIL_684041 [Nephila pilipes]
MRCEILVNRVAAGGCHGGTAARMVSTLRSFKAFSHRNSHNVFAATCTCKTSILAVHRCCWQIVCLEKRHLLALQTIPPYTADQLPKQLPCTLKPSIHAKAKNASLYIPWLMATMANPAAGLPCQNGQVLYTCIWLRSPLASYLYWYCYKACKSAFYYRMQAHSCRFASEINMDGFRYTDY